MVKVTKPVALMKQTRLEIAERVRPLADRLVGQLTDALIAKLESNLSQLSSSFEAMLSSFDSNLAEPLAREPVRKQLSAGRRTKVKSKDGTRRNHCKNCGAEGFQTKTCGITHDKNGAIGARSSRQPRTRTKKRLEDLADDDEEPSASLASAVRVVATQLPPPKAQPRNPPAIPHRVAEVIKPEIKLTPKQMKEKRVREAAIRRAAFRMEKKRAREEPPPEPSMADENELDFEPAPLSEDDAIVLDASQLE